MISDNEAAKIAGVRRLNKKPLAIVGFGLVIIMAILMHAISKRGQDQKNAGKGKPEDKPALVDSNLSYQTLTKDAPVGVVEDKTSDPAEAEPPVGTEPTDIKHANGLSQATGVVGPDGSQEVSIVPQKAMRAKLESAEDKEARDEAKRIRQQKRQMYEAALNSPTAVNVGKIGNDATSMASNQSTPTGENSNVSETVNARLAALAGQAASATDPNNQKRKQDFVNADNTGKFGYLIAGRAAAISPYEVKAGTVIPGVMITGISSDLPGMIVGQVSQNIYDSATGKYLLIPQGTKIVGSYDSMVSYGQSRALVAWNKLTFPDASSIFIGTMSGADQAGYAGFKDKVNNHYVKIFGSAIMISLFSAGIQLSQPHSTNGLQPTAREEIAAEMGRELGQVGMEIVRKNMNIQPTIEIRPGYRFNIMVNKDMILKPYAPMPAQFSAR